MADFLSWFQSNWAALIGAVCGVGSLLFTGAYFRQDSEERKATNTERRAANILALSERHRVLWAEGRQRPELKRVFSRDANLSTNPLTLEEEEFLHQVFVHYEVGWYLAPKISPNEMESQTKDIRDFFSRPLPNAVWQRIKGLRNPEFVRFVERALEANERS